VSLYIQHEVEIYKDNLAFPYFSICLLGKPHNKQMKIMGKGEENSELVSFI